MKKVNIDKSLLFNNLKVYNQSLSNVLYLTRGSHKKFLFTCGFHINKQVISDKIRGRNCGKCINKIIDSTNILNSLLFNNLKIYNRSLSNILYFSSGSHKKCLFTCGFHINLQAIYSKKNNKCILCVNQKINNTNILNSLLFNNLKIYNQSLSNILYLTCRSGIKCLFTCGFHISKQKIANKTISYDNCCKCNNKIVNNTTILKALLFNNLKLYNQCLSDILYLTHGSNIKSLFTCGIHINKQIIKDKNRGRNCGKCCSSKLEKYCRYILNDSNIDYEEQKTFKKCKDKQLLKFDFYLTLQKILIELDGEQHFKNVDHFGINSLQDNKKRDTIKNNYCEINKIRFLRISYSEIKNMRQHISDFIKSSELIRFIGKEYKK